MGVTNRLSDESCSVINDRISLIYSVAPDQLSEITALTKKCGFNPNNTVSPVYRKIPLSKAGKKIEITHFETLKGEINHRIAKNSYIPRRELLIMGLDYTSNLEFILGKPEIGVEAEDKNNIRTLIPIKLNFAAKSSGKQYCESAKSLLENSEYGKQVDDPFNSSKPPGYHSCNFFSPLSGTNRVHFFTTPTWTSKLENIWPLPREFILEFIFKYNNGSTKIFKDVVTTLAHPYNLEAGTMYFIYTDGDLPFAIQRSKSPSESTKYFINGEGDFLELFLDAETLYDLKMIEIKIDLEETFKDSIENVHKKRGKYGPGGVIFDLEK